MLPISTSMIVDVLADLNVALPIGLLEELAAEGRVGSIADHHSSFMGYQAPGLAEWRERYGPEMVEHLKADRVDALILPPA